MIILRAGDGSRSGRNATQRNAGWRSSFRVISQKELSLRARERRDGLVIWGSASVGRIVCALRFVLFSVSRAPAIVVQSALDKESIQRGRFFPYSRRLVVGDGVG